MYKGPLIEADYINYDFLEAKSVPSLEFSEQLDQKVYEWFVAQRSKNTPVSGPLLQERVRQIRRQLGGTVADDFKTSNPRSKNRITRSYKNRTSDHI